MNKVLTIIPTIGSDDLIDSARSVISQKYMTDLLLVVDGLQFKDRVNNVLQKANIDVDNFSVFRLDLPFNTGANGFYGHRIMAGIGHLINHEYVSFLDQDNWYAENHIQSMVKTLEANNFDWGYSLRSIYDKDKNYICDDNCESLGRFNAWVGDDVYLVVSSTYLFKTDFFYKVCANWHSGWGGDRRFYAILTQHFKHNNYGSNKLHTLNYRLGGNEGSVTSDFFIKGNELMKQKYGSRFPWHI